MGESFTIQISSDLVRNLVDDGEKVKKKTRKPKPKISREPPQVPAGSSNLTGWPIQPPMYLPTPPHQKPSNADLDAICSALEASERVVERLKKQEENMLNEVTQRAKELHEKEFKLPNRKPMPCLDEKDACLKCYKENMNDPLKCGQLVEGFAECARRVRQQVGTTENK
ncbi:coiled-coil-helix-coiled-coil-helix domain-containing protein 3 [Striga asiatica]|uniref:Coiled-coil-helix-coiled-coil-helix domain-containing protein 3 n=1 Tax=Striga asiatica TaxID=4170 RepID=A0A5A7PCU8_STRAF|nr:coiled-coil-helix-coiled-coil-helix domain-containing protein 3 [Striga asiatica]